MNDQNDLVSEITEIKETVELVQETELPQNDRAITEFAEPSLRSLTNQQGVGRPFGILPSLAAVSSTFAYPESLRTTKHPVQDFWVYDGAHPGLTDRGKVSTSIEQLLPDKRINEQDAIEWNRVGSKKGWMFHSPVQEEGPGFSGEDVPTHTEDGYPESLANKRWKPVEMSTEKQTMALRQLPAIDIENNARGIGVSGPGSGNGGMSGGYHELNKSRYAALPIPMPKYNWTGNRLFGTAREDQSSGGAGAGGFRAGYKSIYPVQPYIAKRNTSVLSRVAS